jgi:PPOX class probable F420-dependent enzyme
VRRNLTIEDLGDLLSLPLVAVLATIRAEGDVLLSPVWHEWRDGGFTVVSSTDDGKVRHLQRDPRASISVYEATPPYRGIEVRARVRLLREGTAETGRRIAVRYLGREKGEEYAVPSADDVLIRLEPGSLRVWDFVDEYGAVSTR